MFIVKWNNFNASKVFVKIFIYIWVGGEENITSQTQENIEKEKFHLFVSNYKNMKTHLGRKNLISLEVLSL